MQNRPLKSDVQIDLKNSVTRWLEILFCPIFEKSSQNSHEAEKCEIYIKAKFESPKHLHQPLSKPKNEYNKPCFDKPYSSENVKKIA
jgi:hypothetical protein